MDSITNSIYHCTVEELKHSISYLVQILAPGMPGLTGCLSTSVIHTCSSGYIYILCDSTLVLNHTIILHKSPNKITPVHLSTPDHGDALDDPLLHMDGWMDGLILSILSHRNSK